MKKKQQLYAVIIFCMVCLAAGSCKKTSSFDYPAPAVSLYEIITEDNINFSYLKSAVDRAGLGDLISGGEYMLFSPTNTAFLQAGYNLPMLQAMPLDSLDVLVKNHLVAGRIDIHTVADGTELTALSGEKIRIQKIGEAPYINGGDVTNGNLNATNGSLQVINKVLVKRVSVIDRLRAYSTTTANTMFTFLLEALARAGAAGTDYIAMLDDPAASYTFFAPNNGAFIDAGYGSVAAVTAALPEELDNLIKNHILPDKKYTSELDTIEPVNSLAGLPVYADRLKPGISTNTYINSINSANGGANMEAGNSIIHTVNRFLPVALMVNTIERIHEDESLAFFYAALVKASTEGGTDFIQMLSDPANSYTVFAVSNSGFVKAGYADIEAVKNENPDLLGNMLRFHILNKRVNNINIPENGTTPTLLRILDTNNNQVPASLTILTSGGYSVKGQSNINTIPVSPTNILTNNGLLNVVGEILTP